MSGSLLEITRAAHEDSERLEKLVVADLKNDVTAYKDKLYQGHRVRKCLDSMQGNAAKLRKIYEDSDKSRREEIEALGSKDPGNLEPVYANFYGRLRELRGYHKQFSGMDITEAENDEELLKEEPTIPFTGEEALGRSLDLHELHRQFINAKFGRSDCEYYEYVSSFMEFKDIPRPAKTSAAYGAYLQAILDYLEDFYGRAEPLGNIKKQTEKVVSTFEEEWEAGEIEGWEDKGIVPTPASNAALDLDAFESVEDLLELGIDTVTASLKALGLKAGGTEQQRADRLWMTRGKSLEELPRKLFAKGAVPAALQSQKKLEKEQALLKEVACLEARVAALCKSLDKQIAETKGRVERRAAQTAEERDNELAEDEAELEDSDEEDEYVYNPLKLPLGWDGKPIPYWLYKLHGLNKEYKCEICGEQSYWGRRDFEKHFTEWRHQNGLKALGIPNAYHNLFYEVTLIEDAGQLWEALQKKRIRGYDPELDAEYEDAQGNVYNKKTYDDLKRQGLLE